jgi:type IV pilus assembly protein PilW
MKAHLQGRRSLGFSLVELMVAMTLSLVLLAGALSILYSSKVTYSENDRIARLQEAGRTVVELILRDARATGFKGCGRPLDGTYFSNALTDSNLLLWNMGQPVFGHDGDAGSWKPALNAAIVPAADPESDVLMLRTTREGTPAFQLNAPVITETDEISVNRGSGVTVPVGQTMVINDCRGTSAFAVSGFIPVTATTARIQHVAGGTPGNATNSLLRGFSEDARVSFIDTVIYYVSNDGTGPALYRRIGNDPADRLIPGVENIQIRYGIDNNGDLRADDYLKAGDVDDAGRWGNVISLTIAVLVRSEDETNLERDTRTYDLLDKTNFDPTPGTDDRRQRSLFITTVTLRNQTT